MIEVRPSPVHDRGVFTTQVIPKGKVVIVDSVVIFLRHDWELIRCTKTLIRYYWNWTGGSYAIVLGKGSLINASKTDANIEAIRYERQRLMVFKTTREIAAHEELFLDYRKA